MKDEKYRMKMQILESLEYLYDLKIKEVKK
jgi:hypothetical protein